ncbi:MAG TPA: maleylpyruvate isomerase N-terminal domain-containing protein [Candidatus Limnocylindrales bacterium]
MTGPVASPDPELRHAPLAELQRLDFRSAARDPWADEAALWARLLALLDDLPPDAWDAPISTSDAGGPDWTLLDHVAHLAAWQEEAEGYVGRALAGRGWPRDEDYGDFDAFNEGLRTTWAELRPADVRTRLLASHGRLLALARRVPPADLRAAGWEWVFFGLHGHVLDHLAALEPAVERVRAGAAQVGAAPGEGAAGAAARGVGSER